jgi:DNA-binding response OmpR family regulator
MARILSVSYDELLLRTRHLILEREGYDVVSSLSFDDSVEHCKRNDFDLLILGHSIQHSDKQQLVETFRHECPAPIISLRRLDEPPVSGADYCIDPDPPELLKVVATVLRGAAGPQG